MRQLLNAGLAALGVLICVACQGLLGIEEATLRDRDGVGGAGVPGAGGGAQEGGAGGSPEAGGAGEAGSLLTPRIRYQRVADTFGAMVVGADGNFWLTGGDSLRRVTLDWKVTDFPLPEGFSPEGLALGVDDNVWFTRGDRVGRITPAGMIAEFPLPGESNARWLCSGPDTELWFIGSSTLGKVSISGQVEAFTAPPNSDLVGITGAEDGTLWLTDKQQNAIINVAVDGAIGDSWVVPTSNAQLSDIAEGPDGNLWFLEAASNKLAKLEASGLYRGRITEYVLPAGGIPSSLVAAPDGAIWITLYDVKQLIRVETSGQVTDVFPLLAEWTYPDGLVVGSDGNLWFGAAGNLVRFEL